MAIKKENQNVITLSIGMIILLAILFGTNPPARNALLTYIVFLAVSVFIYTRPRFQTLLIGIGKTNLARAIFFGVFFGGIYWAITRFVPLLSLGLLRLPGSIGTGLELFIVVIVASIVEEIFFRGGLLAYIRLFNPSKKKIVFAIILQGILFGLAHLGSYLTGFYNFPDLPSGFAALGQNMGAFIAATTFGIIAGWFVTRNGIRNLIFAIIFHAMLNATILGILAVTFL